MPPASRDTLASQLSPANPHSRDSTYKHRNPDTFTARRLSVAIDALRHESEAILWEMNSLKTHIATLEQRIIGQTVELDVMSRNLAALRERHSIMEQQYQEKLRALRSELRAAEKRQPSTSTQCMKASSKSRPSTTSHPSSKYTGTRESC